MPIDGPHNLFPWDPWSDATKTEKPRAPGPWDRWESPPSPIPTRPECPPGPGIKLVRTKTGFDSKSVQRCAWSLIPKQSCPASHGAPFNGGRAVGWSSPAQRVSACSIPRGRRRGRCQHVIQDCRPVLPWLPCTPFRGRGPPMGSGLLPPSPGSVYPSLDRGGTDPAQSDSSQRLSGAEEHFQAGSPGP